MAFEFNDISNLALWLEARFHSVVSDGTAVSSLADQSGNTNDASQATSADQPAYRTGGPNGHPYIEFDKSNSEWMSGTGLSISGDQPLTVVSVVKPRTQNSVSDAMSWPIWSLGAETDPNTNDRRVVVYAKEDTSQDAIQLNGGNALFADSGSGAWQIVVHRYASGGTAFGQTIDQRQTDVSSSTPGSLNFTSGDYHLARVPENITLDVDKYGDFDFLGHLIYAKALTDDELRKVVGKFNYIYQLNSFAMARLDWSH